MFHWHQVYRLPVNSIRIFNAYGTRSRTSGAYGAVFGVFLQAEARRQAVHRRRRRHADAATSSTSPTSPRRSCAAAETDDVRRGLEPRRRQPAVGQPPGRAARRPGGAISRSGRASPTAPGPTSPRSRAMLGWQPQVSLRGRRGRMLADIDYWRDAPLWDPESIAKATETAGSRAIWQPRDAAMMDDASRRIVSHKIKTPSEIAAADRRAAAREESDHVPRHVRPRASRARAPSALRQEQGATSWSPASPPTRTSSRPTSGRTCRRTCARSTSRRSRWSTTSSSTTNATPLENIGIIQPDYFAKGYEYTDERPASEDGRREVDVVEAYGGEMIFTPGDIVYSSSRIIETEPPPIAIEKLMLADGGRGRRLRRPAQGARQAAAACEVHVVGDTIVDSYTHTHA